MKIELELTPMQLLLLREIVHDAAYRANASYHTASQTARFRPNVLEQRRLKMQLTQALFNAMPGSQAPVIR